MGIYKYINTSMFVLKKKGVFQQIIVRVYGHDKRYETGSGLTELFQILREIKFYAVFKN